MAALNGGRLLLHRDSGTKGLPEYIPKSLHRNFPLTDYRGGACATNFRQA